MENFITNGLFWLKPVIGLALLFMAGLSRAEVTKLILADNGRTEYQIVSAGSASKLDRLAAADLSATLNEITGADFSAAAGKKKSIFVGIPAPADKVPLKEFERRIVTQDGNIYIYGEGKYGTNNAVYDFLRDELGCRWFNSSGDRKIPKSQKLVIGKLKKSLIPSIPYLTTDRVNNRPADVLAFTRRNAIIDEREIFIQYRLHAGQKIIPSGKVPFGGRIGNTFGPVASLKDKAYFETHPEYFSMNAKGKRNCRMQLCYSNMEMRDEFVRNLEIIIKADNYKGGQKFLGVGQDDNSGPFCHCRNCKELVKKYDSPAGPYYDFLFDLSTRFAKKYPHITLCFLAYRYNQTLFPPKFTTKLPDNLLPCYAPLGSCDFTKPLNFRPVNAVLDDCFKKWADISDRLYWCVYPTPYPRPVVSFPLIANIHRIAENFRLAYRYKVFFAYCQFGASFYNNFGFNDLRTYLIAQLCRDITLDERKIIAEYMEGCYGKAAPMMLNYLAELEKLEAETDYFLRWNPDILSLPYTTGDNLLRWERDFDEMEKMVAGDPRALLNIRRARFNLDETLIAKWQYLMPEQRKIAGDLEKVIARATETLIADLSDLYKELLTHSPQKYQRSVKRSLKWLHSGFDQFAAAARGGKPLPEDFAKHKKLFRILPNRNKKALDSDPEAPFGLCTVWDLTKTKTLFNLLSFDLAAKPPQWKKRSLPESFTPDRIAGFPADGKYHYYHLGAIKLSRDCRISTIDPLSGFSLSPLYDPHTPGRLYDIHTAIAVSPDRKQIKFGEIVVIPSYNDAVK